MLSKRSRIYITSINGYEGEKEYIYIYIYHIIYVMKENKNIYHIINVLSRRSRIYITS